MSIARQIQVALQSAPPLTSTQQKMIYGCCRRLTDQEIRIRVRQFINQNQAYKPFLEPVLANYRPG